MSGIRSFTGQSACFGVSGCDITTPPSFKWSANAIADMWTVRLPRLRQQAGRGSPLVSANRMYPTVNKRVQGAPGVVLKLAQQFDAVPGAPSTRSLQMKVDRYWRFMWLRLTSCRGRSLTKRRATCGHGVGAQ